MDTQASVAVGTDIGVGGGGRVGVAAGAAVGARVAVGVGSGTVQAATKRRPTTRANSQCRTVPMLAMINPHPLQQQVTRRQATEAGAERGNRLWSSNIAGGPNCTMPRTFSLSFSLAA